MKLNGQTNHILKSGWSSVLLHQGPHLGKTISAERFSTVLNYSKENHKSTRDITEPRKTGRTTLQQGQLSHSLHTPYRLMRDSSYGSRRLYSVLPSNEFMPG